MKIYLAASFASDDPKRTAAFKSYINYAAKILREKGHGVESLRTYDLEELPLVKTAINEVG